VEWIWTFDPVFQHVVAGIIIVAMMGCGAFVLVRAGRSPLWSVLLLIPVVQLIAVWIFAFVRWPRIDDKDD
jgi:hypothetical protein